MKRYIKDGKIKTRNQIVIKGQRTIKDKDGNDKVVTTNTYNPTEEVLFADGWVEYVTPVYEPTIEDYRKRKKDEILRYDSSDEVNAFYIQGKKVWLDKATRAGLMLRLQSEIAAGREKTTLWYDGKHYELPLSAAMQMLYAIELYASQCYDVTQAHLAAIQELQTIEEIESYDYTQGYPAKLEF
jgi:hypothetical protein